MAVVSASAAASWTAYLSAEHYDSVSNILHHSIISQIYTL